VNEKKETVGNPLKVVLSKKLPGGAMLSLCDLDGVRFYVRENVLPDGKQVLELEAPEEAWLKLSAIVKIEDSLSRDVIRNENFTVKWARKELGLGA
jgi:hypothetical protein